MPSALNKHRGPKSPGLRERKIGAPPSVISAPIIDDSAVRYEVDSTDSSENGNDKKKKNKEDSVGFFSLFRYATSLEWFLMTIGAVTSTIAASLMPLEVILYGEFTSLLVYRKSGEIMNDKTIVIQLFGGGRQLDEKATEQEKNIALIEDSVAFGLACVTLALVQFVVTIWGVDLFNFTARRQITRIRKMYFESVIRQEMAWFDTNITDNFTTGVSENLEKMKDGMGEKVSIFIFMIMSFVSSLVVSFLYGWKLTMIVLICTPAICVCNAIVAKLQSMLTKRELKAYGAAGHVAEEVLNAIRTVVAFNGEKKEVQRYSNLLAPAKLLGIRRGLVSGLGSGIIWLIIYINYAFSFWYGINLILNDRAKPDPEYTPAVMIIVFFGVLAGAEQLGLTAPLMETFASSVGAAASIFRMIGRESLIDGLAEKGSALSGITHSIEFVDVRFHYPSRPDVPILRGLNLKIKIGETVALVGASGCGKSTCIQLLQRLYDPESGSVNIDGQSLDSLNLHWLRSQIGVVGQEPALFSMTIEENIRYGNLNATQDQIEKAAKDAYCHDFIKNLPDGYKTMVGERGAQLSGGQKQRIAIARALIKNPKILLLDEATSALDLQSEAKVQKALERAAEGRTTIIVAHRLTTIKNAHRIIYLEKGYIVEMGPHEELMKQKGKYYNLVKAEEPGISKLDLVRSRKIELPKAKVITNKNAIYEEESDSEEEFGSTVVEEIQEEVKKVSIWTLLKYNKQEWHILLIATVSAFLIGASFPAFAIIFGEFYGLLAEPDDEYVRGQILMYSGSFIIVGIITALGSFLQVYLFTRAGTALTKRLRMEAFETMLKQEMAWFDLKVNSVGALTNRLATDCNTVQGATGIRIGAIVQAASTLLLGIALSLYYTWKMTLVSMTSVPIVLGAVILEGRVMDSESSKVRNAIEASSKIAAEAIMNIRTVAGLCAERIVIDKYDEAIARANQAARSRDRFRGIVFGLGQTIPFAGYAVSLYYGGVLAANDEVHYKNVIKVSEALIFGAWMIGQALAFAPNFRSAIVSAGRIFSLIERQPSITSPPHPKPLEDFVAKGEVAYQAVEFRYPTRPEMPVLRSLYLDVPAGKTVALVGQSGCGKSTCVQLLQRLYDADAGKIALDDMQINRDYSLPKLRSQMGIVSQEPVLFDKTIAENIAYGDNDREVTMAEIVQAAKEANIHNFVLSLPKGYETSLGTKGTQLSGGQKQRIAIARALVRNPRIILLDEATSALDMESEKVVSEALEKARSGRTCIMIAHRLASVRRAHLIAVVHEGQVAETGTPDELLRSNGLYAQLYSLQEEANL